MKNSIILTTLFALTILSCKNEPAQTESPVARLPVNYVVLLDLSDRLLCQGQAERDIEIVSSVYKEYDSQVRKNLVINSRDKFQVIIAPQKGIRYCAQDFENNLFIDMESLNSGVKINTLVAFGNNLPSKLKELYSSASQGKNTADFQGAAIWQFFNEKLQYLIDVNYRNYLVVITDGYFDLEDYGRQLPSGNRFPTTSFLSSVRDNVSWKEILEEKDMGLLPVKKDFSDLQIIVSEISPKYDFQYEADMLNYVWLKWCREMKINEAKTIVRTSLPQSITLLIKNLNSDL